MTDITKALAALPEREQRVVWLKYRGYFDREIAVYLGVCRRTVVRDKARVRVKMRGFVR